MKRIPYLALIILSPLFVLSQGFVLKGNIEGLQSGSVSLAYINEAGEDTTLTAPITDGTFTFAGSIPEPEQARLTITQGWPYNISFFLENGAINMHMVEDAPEKTAITGSTNEIIYEKLKPGLNDFFEHARQNTDAHHPDALAHNRQAIQSADSIWAAQQGQWIRNIRTTISSNTENYAALYFIRWLLFKPDNYDSIFSAFMQLSPAVRQGPAGKKLLADMEHLHKTSPGQKAPEISGTDTVGRPVRLAAYKGKVILLDFWSSYCGPCRQENKRLLPVYEKYHAAGFEIISFSLDNERNLWLQAMRADGLVWPQVSELRGGASVTADMYEITDLPRNVLIGRTGNIYAKDLHGEELINSVEGLLQKRE